MTLTKFIDGINQATTAERSADATRNFSKHPWLLFFIVYLVAALSSFAMFKAPPVFPQLITHLGFNAQNVGWTTSMFAIIGVLLGFPAGSMVNRLGFTRSLLVTAGSVFLGSVIGCFAQDTVLMLFSRVIEGVAMGLASVVGPAAITQIMPLHKQGFAQGFFATWFPFGTVAGLNLSAGLQQLTGAWQASWWVGICLSLIAIILTLTCFKLPNQAARIAQNIEEPQLCDHVQNAQEYHKNYQERQAQVGQHKLFGINLPTADWKSVVLAGMCLFFWNISYAGALGSFMPTFLMDIQHFSPALAGFASSLTPLLVLIFGPIAGFIADKYAMRRGLMIFANAWAFFILPLALSQNVHYVWFYLVFMAPAAASMPTGLYALVPRLAQNPRAVSHAMGIIAITMNLGIMLGASAFGVVIAHVGWHISPFVFLCPCALLALLCACFTKGR